MQVKIGYKKNRLQNKYKHDSIRIKILCNNNQNHK